MLADIVWFGFVIGSGLRVLSYIPRIWRIAADKTGAAAISYTMWGLWAAAYVTAAVYAAASLHNIWLAFASAIYAACCVTVMVLAALKRAGWRIRATSPLL
jgi:Flp pilus assembly pilin Flp